MDLNPRVLKRSNLFAQASSLKGARSISLKPCSKLLKIFLEPHKAKLTPQRSTIPTSSLKGLAQALPSVTY